MLIRNVAKCLGHGSHTVTRHTQHVAEPLPIVFIHSAVSVVDGDALKYFRCTQLICTSGGGLITFYTNIYTASNTYLP